MGVHRSCVEPHVIRSRSSEQQRQPAAASPSDEPSSLDFVWRARLSPSAEKSFDQPKSYSMAEMASLRPRLRAAASSSALHAVRPSPHAASPLRWGALATWGHAPAGFDPGWPRDKPEEPQLRASLACTSLRAPRAAPPSAAPPFIALPFTAAPFIAAPFAAASFAAAAEAPFSRRRAAAAESGARRERRLSSPSSLAPSSSSLAAPSPSAVATPSSSSLATPSPSSLAPSSLAAPSSSLAAPSSSLAAPSSSLAPSSLAPPSPVLKRVAALLSGARCSGEGEKESRRAEALQQCIARVARTEPRREERETKLEEREEDRDEARSNARRPAARRGVPFAQLLEARREELARELRPAAGASHGQGGREGQGSSEASSAASEAPSMVASARAFNESPTEEAADGGERKRGAALRDEGDEGDEEEDREWEECARATEDEAMWDRAQGDWRLSEWNTSSEPLDTLLAILQLAAIDEWRLQRVRESYRHCGGSPLCERPLDERASDVGT